MQTTEEGVDILERLERIEKAVKETQVSVQKIKQFMFWRLVVLAFVVILPLIALPFVIMNFMDTYVASFEGLL